MKMKMLSDDENFTESEESNENAVKKEILEFSNVSITVFE